MVAPAQRPRPILRADRGTSSSTTTDLAELPGLAPLVGNTPLLHLGSLSRQAGLPIYAKAEWTNPGGSVKDRPARHILLDALSRGELGPARPGRRLLDATSGNTGIAYATLAPSFDISVTLCLPGNASRERQQILKALGTELILTDPLEGSDGAIVKAQEMAQADPERYHHVDQYANDANWRAHYETTGPEIWAQTYGRITHFVAGLGTTGTLVGTSRSLKDRDPKVQAIAVGPDGPFHGLEGLKHLDTAIVPEIWDATAPDRVLEVATEPAQGMVRRLAQEEGLLVGPSGGAAALASLLLAKELAEEGGYSRIAPDEPVPSVRNTPPGTPVVVTLFPDNASKYLSSPFWEEGV
ncbi:MAG: cysteine synthase family protein [Euryarchaeota archaeon]|nr:cysteine synthase family protein [Euryarchaeota archaeon]